MSRTFETDAGTIRWERFGEGEPIVLVHGTPYSSYLWRDVAPALAGRHTVHVFDHLGYGASEKREGQDLSIAAQARRFTELVGHWGLDAPRVVANDIGGSIVLRAHLLEGLAVRDLTIFDAVSGGAWERGLFALMRENPEVFAALPPYAHEALVGAHLDNATARGYRPGVREAFLAPWRGEEGQAAYYRQYRQLAQADTEPYEHLLGSIEVPVTLLWGTEDRILPPEYGTWLHERIPHSTLTWIEGAGHLLQEDAPGQLVAALLR
ncbi:alpha/beta fold hydrolase [Actinomycetospora termitidis]|uniref:Alpha/beta hydrolase n=1 Tax=Actinomycetospora termitidis TaxID=3053470 RepID=A0ABT7M9N4_9PSEU|nr:alpha/beta hydrolase [Actinomycetospora sp. Odt1-22]MDL5157389.1 alpha/beta hydrolase [Actinomycetospora sp. Odt1-22]